MINAERIANQLVSLAWGVPLQEVEYISIELRAQFGCSDSDVIQALAYMDLFPKSLPVASDKKAAWAGRALRDLAAVLREDSID